MKKEKRIEKNNCSIAHNSVTNRSLLAFLSSFFILLFSFLSCNDPVFFAISTEVKIPPPIIPGSPTNYAEIGNYLYVGSGTAIYKYNIEKAEETRICYACKQPQPYWLQKCTTCAVHIEKIQPWSYAYFNNDRITNLTSVNSVIYILTLSTLGISNIYASTSLDPLSFSPLTIPDEYLYYRLISMYSAKDQIFVGAMNILDSNYTIFRITDNTIKELEFDPQVDLDTSQKLLNGAAYANGVYYLSVKDQKERLRGGVYSYSLSSNTAALVPINVAEIYNDYSIPFMGIIDIDNINVIAIDRNGILYAVEQTSLTPVKRLVDGAETEFILSTGRLSNGVLYVAYAFNDNTGKLDSDRRILLAGRQDTLTVSANTRFTYGYHEIELEGSNINRNNLFFEPGNITSFAPSTLPKISGSVDRFRTTIGTYPIKCFYQVKHYKEELQEDGTTIKHKNATLFASTHNDGVWVLRDWNNINVPYWNAEN